jgi:hypothetical protein
MSLCTGVLQLCRKDLLAKNIKRHKRGLEKEGKLEEAARFDFTPITFILPGDYALFVEVCWTYHLPASPFTGGALTGETILQ